MLSSSMSTGQNTFAAAITGTGDPNAIVTFKLDGNAIAATAIGDSTGKWAFTMPGLSNGSHTVVASEIDSAGNIGTASLPFAVGTTLPLGATAVETFYTNVLPNFVATTGVSSSTAISFSNGTYSDVYTGTFSYVGNNVFGTVTGFTEYAGTSPLVTLSNFSMDASLRGGPGNLDSRLSGVSA